MDSDDSMNPISGNDALWDGSVLNPLGLGISTSLSQILTPTTVPSTAVASLRVMGDLHSDPVPNRSMSIPVVSSVTHTISRPVDTVVSTVFTPNFLTGLNAMQVSSNPPQVQVNPSSVLPRWPHPWPMHYPYYGFQGDPSLAMPRPASLTSVQNTTSSSAGATEPSVVSQMQSMLNDLKQSLSSQFESMASRIETLENQSAVKASVVPSSPQSEEDPIEDDVLSVAPGTDEESFLVDDNTPTTPPPSSQATTSVCTELATNEDQALPKESLKARVYSLLREKTQMELSSPPRLKKSLSSFETSCGLAKENTSSYKSLPESKHVSSALQVVKDKLDDSLGEMSATTSAKFPGFGAASFPGRFNSKDYEVHGSSIGKTSPTLDKASSSLLGAKTIEGLRLSQSVWSKTENLLRSTSHVLGSADYFLSAAGCLLQGKEGTEYEEIKSFLLQVDQSIGVAQLLLMGSLFNFTLSKRTEILEKASVSEAVKDSLLASPLTDKIFGLSLKELQAEIAKHPQPVKVNVQVSGGKRAVVSTPSSSQPAPKKKKVVKPHNSSSTSVTKSNPKTKGGKKSGYRR